MTSETTTAETIGPPLGRALADNWFMLLLRGIAAVIFGLLCLLWPGLSLLTMVLFFGGFVLVDGAASLVAGIMGKTAAAPRWWLILVGLLGIAAGIATIFLPGMTGLLLLYLIAFWAIVTGVLEIIGAFMLRKEIDNEWMLILSGVVSVLFGALMVLMPGTGVLALVWMIGFYAIFFGILEIAFAFRLRRHKA